MDSRNLQHFANLLTILARVETYETRGVSGRVSDEWKGQQIVLTIFSRRLHNSAKHVDRKAVNDPAQQYSGRV